MTPRKFSATWTTAVACLILGLLLASYAASRRAGQSQRIARKHATARNLAQIVARAELEWAPMRLYNELPDPSRKPVEPLFSSPPLSGDIRSLGTTPLLGDWVQEEIQITLESADPALWMEQLAQAAALRPPWFLASADIAPSASSASVARIQFNLRSAWLSPGIATPN